MELFTIVKNSYEPIGKVFGKTVSEIDQDVEIIKKWLSAQPHLPETMESVKILNFLLINKFSIERTKQKIDMYYSIRSIVPKYFESSNPKSTIMKYFMKTTYCCLHPKLVHGLYRVFFIKLKFPNQLMVSETGLQCANINEIRLYEDLMFGDIMIFDIVNVTLADFTKVTPALVAKLIGVYEKVFSLRVKKVLVINGPSFAIHLVNLVKLFLKPKIISRIEICSGIETLKEIFADKDLPLDYGGSGPSLTQLNDLINEKLHKYQDRFDKLDVLKVNEKQRPQKLDNDEVLGFYGNFKTLNID